MSFNNNFDVNKLYPSANAETKKMLEKIREIAIATINDRDFILEESIEDETDYETEWISYYMKLSMTAEMTVKMNQLFIDHCVNDTNSDELLNCNIVFIFESGK